MAPAVRDKVFMVIEIESLSGKAVDAAAVRQIPFNDDPPFNISLLERNDLMCCTPLLSSNSIATELL
jgi:hypothetical protein